jgi:hypothetical protein
MSASRNCSIARPSDCSDGSRVVTKLDRGVGRLRHAEDREHLAVEAGDAALSLGLDPHVRSGGVGRFVGARAALRRDLVDRGDQVGEPHHRFGSLFAVDEIDGAVAPEAVILLPFRHEPGGAVVRDIDDQFLAARVAVDRMLPRERRRREQ